MRRVLRAWPLLAVAALIAVPFIPGKDAAIYGEQITPLFIYAILALGLNLVVGQVGVFHLGIAAFFGIGAYAAGILSVRQFPFQQSFLVIAAVAVLSSALLGIITTAPILRLRGDYLALVTMAFGLIAVYLFTNLEQITNGTKGLNPVSPQLLPGAKDPNLAGLRFHTNWGTTWRRFPHFYFLCFAVLLTVFAALALLERSRLGRAWVALREDELAASCMGLNPARLKLIAIAIGAGIAGLAGSLYAIFANTTTEPRTFDFNLSMTMICCIILGGLGSRTGAVFGVFLLLGFDQIATPRLDNWVQKEEMQRQFPAFMQGKAYIKMSMWKLGTFGMVLILMMRFRPEGLFPEKRRQHELEAVKPDGHP
ncbi:MAG TPA: branched-chain amino acid ABC transporter permease [Gemmataceae bacterium]|jgi:branched-chain amino acid transport system permease protein